MTAIKLTAAYQVEGFAMAVQPGHADKAKDFSLFETEKVAVDLGTLSDIILLSVRNHKLIDRVVHVRGEEKAAKAYDAGEVIAFYGEAAPGREPGASGVPTRLNCLSRTSRSPRNWPVGGAVQAKAVDLADAVDREIAAFSASGELKKIFASYGVASRPPAQER